jgi:hypothetical protein
VFYERVYDINSPGWVKVRELAEPGRQVLYDLFRKEYVDQILPSPDRIIGLDDPIKDSSKRKLLLGLSLIGRNHPFDAL